MTDYAYANAKPLHSHKYLVPIVMSFCPPLTSTLRVLDIGCGNGAMAGEFIRRGCKVVGIDSSTSGIAQARESYPTARFEVLAANENILTGLNEPPFDLVISTEVVEHIFAPRDYIKGCFAATRIGGRFICSTPYHGYLKNLAISIAGKWDTHANPLWDLGHVKLWSYRTLRRLFTEAGFHEIEFRGSGRWPWLWKSMVMTGAK